MEAAGIGETQTGYESSHPLEARDRCQHDLHGSLRHPVTFPLGRVGRPDDAAIAVSFLASTRAASDQGSYISGIELFVDGGLAQV